MYKKYITPITVSIIIVIFIYGLDRINIYYFNESSYRIRFIILTIFSLLLLIFYSRYKYDYKHNLKIPIFIAFFSPLLHLIINYTTIKVIFWETNLVLKVVLISFLVGMFEEIIFRGVLYKIWYKYPQAIYLLVSSFLFGLVHFDKGIIGVIFAFIMGLSFGLARVAGLSLWILIVLHSLIDFITLMPSIVPTIIIFDYKISLTVFLAGYIILISYFYLSDLRHWRINGNEKDHFRKRIESNFTFYSDIFFIIILTFILGTHKINKNRINKQKNSISIIKKSTKNL